MLSVKCFDKYCRQRERERERERERVCEGEREGGREREGVEGWKERKKNYEIINQPNIFRC